MSLGISNGVSHARGLGVLIAGVLGTACHTPYDSDQIQSRISQQYGASEPWFESSAAAPSSPPLGGAPGEGQLADYVGRGLMDNAGLRAAFHKWRAATEAIPQATAWPEPRFSYAYYVEEIQTRTGPMRNRFGLAQRLPWFGKLDLRGDVAGKKAEEAWWQLQNAQLQVIRDIKRAYFEYAYLAQDRELTRENLELLRQLEAVVQRRVAVGGAQADLLRVQVEISRLEDRAQSLEQLRPALSAKLAASVNLPRPHGTLPDPKLTEPVVVAVDEQKFRETAQSANPLLRGLQERIEGADYGVDLAEREGWPDLTVGVEYIDLGQAVVPVQGSGTDPWALSLSMELPIWRGKYQAARRQARAQQQAAMGELYEQQAQLASQLEMSVFKVRDAARQIELYRDSLLPRARQTLEVTESSYRTGTASFLEMIDSQQTLLSFERSYWRACADYEQSLADLEAICGGEVR